MDNLDTLIESYADAQAALARGILQDYRILVAPRPDDDGPKNRKAWAIDILAGRCAFPVRQIERLLAFARADYEARNGVPPEVYGEIFRAGKPEQEEALLAAAETGRWNVDTAHDAVRAHRARRKVQREQVYSAMRQAETICGGEITADRVLGLLSEERLELRKPLNTVARFAGQDNTVELTGDAPS